MANNESYKSMVSIVEDIIKEKGKQNLYSLMETVANIKGFSKEDEDKLALLYLDMTLSSKFVYCGNDEWDIKDNNLELWDKDGAYFAVNEPDYVEEEDEDEEEEIVLEDYYSVEDEEVEIDIDDEDEDEEEKEEEDEEDVTKLLDDDIPFYSTDDDDVETPDIENFDDDDYHDIMDDYEDMYD